MKNNYNATIAKLINDNWLFDHSATVKNYKYSGSVSHMQTKNGFEFCRVHIGKTYNKKIYYNGGYYNITLQASYVYKRALTEAIK